jgi:caffeoyl-CoA O-methyltransferase
MRKLTMGLTAVCAIALFVYSTVAQPPPGQLGRGARSGRGTFAPPRGMLLAIFDADNDGEISAAEIAGAAGALKKLDANNDGKLSAEEIGPRQGRFGGPGMGGPGRGMRSGERGPMRGGAAASRRESSPLANSDAEKKILDVLSDMDRNQRRGMMNVPVWDGRMLRLLTEAVGAKRVVEIGTSNGYSGIWFCLALRTTGGKLITHDLDPGRAGLARKNFARAGVEDLVTLVLGDAHQEVTKLKGPIDVLFIDADKEGYPDYLKKLLPLVRPGGLILAHNTDMRGAGIAEYVEAVTTNPDLETLFLGGSSLGVTLKKR